MQTYPFAAQVAKLTPCLALAFACGPKSGTGSEASSDSSSESSGPTTEPEDNATAPATGSEGSTTLDSQDPACEEFESEEAGAPVIITIANRTSAPLYLDWMFEIPKLGLRAPGVEWTWKRFGPECENLMDPSANVFCGQPAPSPLMLELQPGETLPLTWTAMYEPAEPPLDCVAPEHAERWPCEFAPSCSIVRQPPPGRYALELAASTAFVTEGEGEPVPCEGDPCILENAYPGGETLTAQLEFDYPTQAVELAFE